MSNYSHNDCYWTNPIVERVGLDPFRIPSVTTLDSKNTLLDWVHPAAMLILIHRKESVTNQSGKQLNPSTSINHDQNMHDSMTQDMKMSHDAGIQSSHHNRMIIEKSQTDPVKSRNKEVTLNSRGPIRMETDDKQSAVEIVILLCDVTSFWKHC